MQDWLRAYLYVLVGHVDTQTLLIISYQGSADGQTVTQVLLGVVEAYEIGLDMQFRTHDVVLVFAK